MVEPIAPVLPGHYPTEDGTAASDLLVRMAFHLGIFRVLSLSLCIIFQQQMKGTGKPMLSMNGLRTGAIRGIFGVF